MKKLFLAMAAFAALFTSCSKDDTFGGPTRGKVTFEVSTPELATRYGEGTTATNLQYAVYDMVENADGVKVKVGNATLSGLKATVTIDLVEGREYSVIFWADAPNSPYTFNADDKTVSYTDVEDLTANNEDYDAFFAYVPKGDVVVGSTVNVTLTRPFAQLNIATNDTVKAAGLEVEVVETGIVIEKAYNTLNLATGVASGEIEDLTFDLDNKAEGKIGTYDMLSMNYLFANDKANIDVTFNFIDMVGTEKKSYSRTYSSVPVERNHRTNIVGSILTDATNFNVEILPGFEDTDLPHDELDKLMMAAQVGGEFTLVEDIELESTLNVTSDFTLNLNDKTISGNWAKAKGAVINVAEGVTFSLKNGTVSSTAENGGSAILNNGVATIEDVTINGAPIVDGGWPSYGINNFGTLTVNSADITTYHGAIATGADGVTVINDATVDVGNSTETNQTSWALYVYENGQLTVNGGTFSNTKNEYGQVYGGGYICTSSTKETIINGGTFDKTEIDNNGTGFYYNNQNLVIKGGTFDVNPPAAYLAEGYAAVDNGDGTWTVVKALNSSTISTAFENLSTTEPTTIAVTEDINIAEPLSIPAGAEVTVQLGDKEITSATNDAFVVNEGATLTISGNGAVKSNGAPIRAIGGTVIVEGGTFTQTGAWNTATSTYRYSIDSREGGEVIIKGGTFNTNNGLISVSADSSVVIDGGEFTFENNTGGTRHFAYVSGDLTINDGVFRGVADGGAGGCFFCGAASTCNIQVKGGKFTSLWISGSVNRIFESYASGSTIEVTGGLFNSNGGIESFVEANTDAATMAEYPYKAK